MSMRRKFLRAACGFAFVPALAAAAELDLTLHPGWEKNLPGSSFTHSAPVPAEYKLPAAAFLLSVSRNDLHGTLQMAKGCGVSLALAHAIQAIFFLPDSSAFAPPQAASLCSAAFLQNRYGSGYGVPAISLAAALQGSNVLSIPEQAGNFLLPSLLSLVVMRQFTDRIDGGSFQGITLNRQGVVRFSMPTDTPLIRFNLTASGLSGKGAGGNIPSSGPFVQIGQDDAGKTRVILGFQASF